LDMFSKEVRSCVYLLRSFLEIYCLQEPRLRLGICRAAFSASAI
jgi:hypothetical protein